MKLLNEDLLVLNVGLKSFSDAIIDVGGKASQIEWAPPAHGNATIGRALARLVNQQDVEAANRKAYAAYLSSQPILEGISLAKTAIPGMGRRMLLHAGPPIAWARMCGPMQGAIVGAIMLEGWAEDVVGARKLAESGKIKYRSCHDYGAVGPKIGRAHV